MAAAESREFAPGDPTASAPPAERYQPFGRKPLLTFSLVIGLPAFVLYVSGAIVVLVALITIAV